jgi:hypothetical protein
MMITPLWTSANAGSFRRLMSSLVAFGLLLIVLIFPTAIRAQSPTPLTPTAAPLPSATPASIGLIKMSVEAGFQSHFRPDMWTPLLVSVSNDGPDLTGQLVVNSGNGALGLTSAVYSVPLTLPTHSSKRLFVYAVFNGSAQQAQVDLVDSNGITQISSSAPLSPLNTADTLYVVVDDSPAGSIDLTVARPVSAVGYQSRWSLDNFPTMADAWRGIDVLLLTNTDSGRLTTEQQHALADWVNAGGHLIVTGGPDWQKTVAGVADLSPLTVSGTVTIPAVGALATFANQPADSALLNGTIIAAQGTLAADAQPMVTQTITQAGSQSSIPLIARRRVGSGLVDYLSIDPGLEPIRSWANRGILWQSLLMNGTSSPNRPGWAHGVVNMSAANDAAASALGLRFPDVLQVAGFLLIYILLIGPVNYLGLRLLKRLEWAWFTIPVLIVLATGTAYFTGFNLRGTQPILNRMAVIQVWPGQPRARVDGLLGLISPRRGFLDATIGEGLDIRALPVGSSGLGLTGGSDTQVIESNAVGSGGSYRVAHVSVDTGLAATFILGGTIPAPAIDGSAAITVALDGAVTIQGEVHNRSSAMISDALIIAFDSAHALGALAPGESRSFSYTVNAITQLNRAMARRVLTVNPYNYAYSSNGSTLTSLADLIESASSLAKDSVSNLNQRLNTERQTFMNGLIDPGELGGSRGTDVYFVGWGDTLPFATSLDSGPSVSEDMALYAVQLARTIQPGQAISQPLTLLPGLQTWQSIPATLSATSVNFVQASSSPYGIYLATGDKVAYEFEPLSGLRLATVNQLTITLHSYSGNRATVAVWDWPRGVWISLDPATLATDGKYTMTDPADLGRFVDPGNRVRVLLTASFGQANFDRLDTTLNGTLALPNAPDVVGF